MKEEYTNFVVWLKTPGCFYDGGAPAERLHSAYQTSLTAARQFGSTGAARCAIAQGRKDCYRPEQLALLDVSNYEVKPIKVTVEFA